MLPSKTKFRSKKTTKSRCMKFSWMLTRKRKKKKRELKKRKT